MAKQVQAEKTGDVEDHKPKKDDDSRRSRRTEPQPKMGHA